MMTKKINVTTTVLLLEPIPHSNTRSAGPWHTLLHPFVNPAKALSGGYVFHYPTLEPALRAIVAKG